MNTWSELPQAGPLLLVEQSRLALVTALQDLPGAIYRELHATQHRPTSRRHSALCMAHSGTLPAGGGTALNDLEMTFTDLQRRLDALAVAIDTQAIEPESALAEAEALARGFMEYQGLILDFAKAISARISCAAEMRQRAFIRTDEQQTHH